MEGIRIEDRLVVRFPGRDPSFRAGVEIGMLATLMALRTPEFARSIASDNLDQAATLARELGYHLLAAQPEGSGITRVTFGTARRRPRLKLVDHSTGHAS
jgi:hypothetical protein